MSILSVTMSTSAVDSLQNAIVDNISGVYLKNSPLLVVRGLVLLLTVPPMIVSLKVCASCCWPAASKRDSLIVSLGSWALLLCLPLIVIAWWLVHCCQAVYETCQLCIASRCRATTSSSCF